MPNEKVYDREEIKRLYEERHTVQEIAAIKGCSVSTVRRVIETDGATKVEHSGGYKKLEFRRPILVEEIARYRERLKIGQKVRFEIEEEIDFRRYRRTRELTVITKNNNFFTAKDERGRTYTKMYVEMLMMEREKE